MWTISEVDGRWQLVAANGDVIVTEDRYDQVLKFLGELLSLAAADPDLAAVDAGGEAGLLPEHWTDTGGICFSENTGDGRDFTGCVWTSRDPNVSVLPLMLQTSTDFGHFGAELAGFMTSITTDGPAVGGTPRASGRFYDTDCGRQFRDMLLEGRRFGVSVDNGAVDVEWLCVEMDQDGWCVREEAQFMAYEIIGLTGTPFPAFAAAAIQLTDGASPAIPGPEDAMAASGEAVLAIPAVPRRAAFEMPEPEFGSDLLVQQDDEGHFAVPLTITDDFEVFGHLAWWGQCHVGYPGVCVEPPHSPSGYAEMNLRPLPVAEGGSVLTGPLVVGCDHAALSLFAQEARDHYAHNGLAWADVTVTDGVFGPWFCGALRPGLNDAQLRALRASSVSGDWRDLGQGLDLLLGLTVNGPGFPIRGRAMAAAGSEQRAHRRYKVRNDEVTALVASNVVRRECVSCRETLARGGAAPDAASAELLALVRSIEARTRHLAPAEAKARLARV